MKRYLCLGLAAFSLATSVSAGSLQQVYQQALASDPQLQAATATYLAEREIKQQSRAPWLPNISLSADSTYSKVSPSGLPEGNSNGYQLNLRQSLYRLEEWNNMRAGATQSQQAKVGLDRARQALVRRSVEVYLGVLSAQTDYATSQAVEAAVKRRLDQVQAQFDVGLIAITDVEEARAGYDSARVNRILAKGRLDKSYEAVNRLTGKRWQALDELSRQFPVDRLTGEGAQNWVDQALQGNLNLLEADLNVIVAEQSREAVRARHHPTVDLIAGYGTDNGARAAIAGDSRDTGFIGVQFNLPIYQGGAVQSGVREASYRWDAALALREDSRRAVIEDTRSLYRDIETDVESVEARKQSIVSSETALEAISAGYSVGTRNIVDVLQAEQSLYTAIQNYQNARYNYVRNMLRFKETLGVLSEQDIDQLDQWMVTPGAEPPLYQKRAQP